MRYAEVVSVGCTGMRNVKLAALFFSCEFCDNYYFCKSADQVVSQRFGAFFVQRKIDVRQPSQDSLCVCAHWGVTTTRKKVVHCGGLVTSYQVCPCTCKAV